MSRSRLRPHGVPADVITGMLAAEGPGAELKLTWLWLWSRRSRHTNQIRGYSQADLAAKLGLTERAFRDRVGECARYGMLAIHAGVHGNLSLYALRPPQAWHSTRQPGPVAHRPPRRRWALHAPGDEPHAATKPVEGRGAMRGGMVFDGTNAEPSLSPVGFASAGPK